MDTCDTMCDLRRLRCGHSGQMKVGRTGVGPRAWGGGSSGSPSGMGGTGRTGRGVATAAGLRGTEGLVVLPKSARMGTRPSGSELASITETGTAGVRTGPGQEEVLRRAVGSTRSKVMRTL